MAKKVPITIHSVCSTSPKQSFHVEPHDMIRWKAAHEETFVLKIKGGFFLGEPDPFEVDVDSQDWTGYFEVADKPNDSITNYIYTKSGNCADVSDGPPDIIIDSGGGPGTKPKPTKKPAVKKKSAPKKKSSAKKKK